MNGAEPTTVRLHRTAPGTDPETAAAYRLCRRIAAEHGRTYFLATRLLAPERRPAVHALYAFARVVDDIVDTPALRNASGDRGRERAPTGTARTERPPSDLRPDGSTPGSHPAAAIDRIEQRLRTALHQHEPVFGPQGADDQLAHILRALTHTIRRYDIDPRHFWAFLDSMRMDVPGSPLFRNRYATMTELNEYMHGSAAVIGLQMLPILGTVGPVTAAEPAAAALGDAFQLTNFLRDIGEDLDRDRVYLPADELAAFGVDDGLLAHCRRTGRTERRVRHALAHFIALNRDLYRRADPGVYLLAPRARPAIRTARTLYSALLDRIEAADYQVFDRRAVVPTHQRLRVALAALVQR
ncbi:phytoene/squalene synthase family protein [Nocardia donostiensis]|uniref:phytoene/squalene synthase family protein n=1 Tax=Nocardia donostiensis TaxID=1538463 RepID=UPI0009DA9713|nr:phytoene/squalene synthase family protein [Nocardia donostiensis]